MASVQVGPPYLYADGAIWPVVCTAVVALRFSLRKTQGNRIKIDDWLILPALLCVWGLGCALIATTALDATGHPTPIPANGNALTASSRQQTIVKKLYVIFVVVQTAALGFIKISCLAFYRRIFHTGQSKVTDAILWFLITSVAVWMLAFCFGEPFICGTHFNYLWSSVETLDLCPANTVTIAYALAISDVIMDFLILLFPLPIIWQLKMSVGRKLAVSGIFLLGCCSIAASIFRLVVLTKDLQTEFQEHVDQDLLTGGLCWLMLIEAGFALCAICLPSLSPLFNVKEIRLFFENVSNLFSLHSPSSTVRPAGTVHSSHETLHDRNYISRSDSFSVTKDSPQMPPLPNLDTMNDYTKENYSRNV